MAYALHTWTLSLTQLRRLRFPVNNQPSEERNQAARTVLAALALYSLALQQERGYWLRSRCELIPEGKLSLDLVGGSNGGGPFALGDPREVRQRLVDPAVQAATNLLAWEPRVIRLTPTPQLTELVRRSDALGPQEVSEEQGITDAGTAS